MTAEAANIWGQQQRLRRCDDGPEKLATMAEALTEEDETEESTAKTEASEEEGEETTRPSECIQRRMRRCVYGPSELTTTTAESAEEDGPKDSATTTEALEEDKE